MKRKPKAIPSTQELRAIDAANPELSARTGRLVTEFSGHYLVRCRSRSTHIATMKVLRTMVTQLEEQEPQANELWRLCDSGETEVLLDHLRENPPSPELIVMVMLTGQSKLEQKKESSLGGKLKNSQYAELKEVALAAWQEDTSRRSKIAFASAWVAQRDRENEVLKQKGQPTTPIPEVDTVRKWLKGVPKTGAR